MPLIYNYIAENVRFKSGFDKKLGNGWKLQRPPIPPHGFFGKPLNLLSRAALLPRTLAPLLAGTPAPQPPSSFGVFEVFVVFCFQAIRDKDNPRRSA
jgi:hypothetical protein